MVLCGLSGMLFTNPNLIRISSLCLCSSSVLHEMLVGSELPVLIQTGLLNHVGIHQGDWSGAVLLETNNSVAGGTKRFRERSQSSAPSSHYFPGWSWLSVWWSLGSTGMKESHWQEKAPPKLWFFPFDVDFRPGRCPGLGSACSLWMMPPILLEITFPSLSFFFFNSIILNSSGFGVGVSCFHCFQKSKDNFTFFDL